MGELKEGLTDFDPLLSLYEIPPTRHPGMLLAGVQNFKQSEFQPEACWNDEGGISSICCEPPGHGG